MYERNISNAKNYLGIPASNNVALQRDRNGNMLPAALQNQIGRSHMGSPGREREEQKRAQSVASGDTIISTASSNSPLKKRPLHKKNNHGLQINGIGAGPSSIQSHKSKVGGLGKLKGYNARQSPYFKKGNHLTKNMSNIRGAGNSNTDSEIYGGKSMSLARRENSNIGSGSRNALTLA